MVTGGQVQTAFPEKTSVRGIVYAKGKLGEAAVSRAHAPGEDSRMRTDGRRTIVFDVEFVGVGGKDFS